MVLQRKRSLLLGLGRAMTLLALLGVIAAAPPTASATGMLDQQFAPASTNGSAGATSSHLVAQTFKAGITGGLDQVDLLLGTPADTAEPLTVQIRTLSGGVPSGTVLAQEEVADSAVPEVADWVSVPFSPPAPSTAGTQYAIVLSSSAPGSGYRWLGHTAGGYADGAGLGSFNGGATWENLGGAGQVDNVFKTYVTPAPTSKDQCKKNGWKNFPQFKNQGQCVSFVERQSQTA